MSVIIENNYIGFLPLNIKKQIEKMLKTVPNSYLIGLKKIVVKNHIISKNKGETLGIYKPGNNSDFSSIEIAIDTIYFGYPKTILLIPFLGKLMLGRVLYHEIGHHYQNEFKKVKKKNLEKNADDFSVKLLKEHFYIWRIILSPFKPLMRFLKLIK